MIISAFRRFWPTSRQFAGPQSCSFGVFLFFLTYRSDKTTHPMDAIQLKAQPLNPDGYREGDWPTQNDRKHKTSIPATGELR